MIWMGIIIIVFSLSRLYHLMVVPPFLDEMIYTRWLTAIKLNGDWLIPLKEFGWEPLQIWLAALINRLVTDPVLSLRLTGIFISALAIILIYRLAGKTAALFYGLLPIILVHDRFGLRGDQLVVLAALMVYGGLKKQRWVLIGAGIGLGLLAKTTAAALPLVAIAGAILLKIKLNRSVILGLFLALVPLLLFWLTGTLELVLAKQATFIGGVNLKANLWQAGLWLYQYLTWPVLLLIGVGFISGLKDRALLVSLVIPFGLLVATAKIMFPRYLLPIAPFLAIYAALGFDWLRQSLPRALRPLLIVFLLAPLWFDRQILTDFPSAPLPEIDQWQYINGWPSGYGVKELIDYWQDNHYSAEEILTDKAKNSSYVVTNINHEEAGGELVKEFPRPGNKSAIKLWRLE